MIRRSHVPLTAQIALGRLRQGFVFAVAFPPFQFVVTATTDSVNRRFQYGGGFLAFGIVTKGKRVLVGRGMTLFLLFLQRIAAVVATAAAVVVVAVDLRHFLEVFICR